MIEGEIFHIETGFHHRVLKYVAQVDFSADASVEAYGMKLNHVHDVEQADVLQVYQTGVSFCFSQSSVDFQVLVAVLKQEVMYFDAVFCDVYSSRMDVPGGVIQNDLAGLDVHTGVEYLLQAVLTERSDGVNLSAIGELGVVAPVNGAVQFVVFGPRDEGEIEHGSFFHQGAGA